MQKHRPCALTRACIFMTLYSTVVINSETLYFTCTVYELGQLRSSGWCWKFLKKQETSLGNSCLLLFSQIFIEKLKISHIYPPPLICHLVVVGVVKIRSNWQQRDGTHAHARTPSTRTSVCVAVSSLELRVTLDDTGLAAR